MSDQLLTRFPSYLSNKSLSEDRSGGSSSVGGVKASSFSAAEFEYHDERSPGSSSRAAPSRQGATSLIDIIGGDECGVHPVDEGGGGGEVCGRNALGPRGSSVSEFGHGGLNCGLKVRSSGGSGGGDSREEGITPLAVFTHGSGESGEVTGGRGTRSVRGRV